MEIGKLRDVLNGLVTKQVHNRFPDGAFVASFSLNPPKLQGILAGLYRQPGVEEKKGVDAQLPPYESVFAFFQRYSFRSAIEEGHSDPIRGKDRTDRINAFWAQTSFSPFRLRTRRPVWKQLHLKVMLLRFGNRLVLVQFSRNLNATVQDVDELVYAGLPRNTDALLDTFQELLTMQDPPDLIEDIRPGGRKDAALVELQAMRNAYNASVQDQDTATKLDKDAYLVMQGSRDSMGDGVARVLRDVREASDNATRYRTWKQQPLPRPSVLLLHFPYVNNGLETNMCSVVVNPLSLDVEERNGTDVELAYSIDPFLRNFEHESWVCRLEGRREDDRILWFLLTSNNMTLPSWIPQRIDVGVDFPLPSPRSNLECAVLQFSTTDRDFNPAIYDRVRTRMLPSQGTALTTVKCDVDKSSLPPPAMALTRAVGDACPETNAAEFRIVFDPDAEPLDAMPTIARFQRAKRFLTHFLLPGMVGLGPLRKALKWSYYVRYALYDYLFNDLGFQHPIARLHGYTEHMARRYFTEAVERNRDAHPWCKCGTARATLDALVDMFVKMANAFDYYDPRINAARPQVTEATIMTLYDAKDGEQVVEDPWQRSRPACTPYDTLTFVLQSMHSYAYMWWACSRGHTFYWNPRNMVLGINACPVCAKYHDVRQVYELLQQRPDVTRLTVEFPLLRRYLLEDDAMVPMDPPDPEMDARRKDMRYDVFFLYQNRYYCGIEFDDASHSSRPQNQEPIVVQNPNADASKNVLSSAMGIHLMRIWTKSTDLRPNAKSRLGLLVDTFLATVAANGHRLDQNPLPNNDNVLGDSAEAFQSRMARFHVGVGEDGLYPEDLLTLLDQGQNGETQLRWDNVELAQSPNDRLVVLQNLRIAVRRRFPVSLIFATDVPDRAVGEERALLDDMIERGYDHPCVGRSIRVDRQTTPISNRAYYRLLKEWRDARADEPQAFAVQTRGYRGRLLGSFSDGFNSLALVARESRQPVTVMGVPRKIGGYLLETKRLGPWRFDVVLPEAMFDERRSQMVAIAKSYVRVKQAKVPDALPRADEPWHMPPNPTRWAKYMKDVYDVFGGRPPSNDNNNDDDEDEEQEVEWPAGWPATAGWAVPGKRIAYNKPQNPITDQNEDEDDMQPANFDSEEILQVVHWERRFTNRPGLQWWIRVTRPTGSKWIPEEDFRHITSAEIPNSGPLFDVLNAAPAQLGVGRRARRLPERLRNT
jgi:hypothetical protein